MPATSRVSLNQIFTVNIEIAAGAQQVDGGAAYLNFDTGKLRVVDAGGAPASAIDAGSSLPTALQNFANNPDGRIDYAAGAGLQGGTPPTGTFILASIRFKAIATTGEGGTPVVFVSDLPRKTDATRAGGSVLGTVTGGVVIVQ